jgi:hypothetical protein
MRPYARDTSSQSRHFGQNNEIRSWCIYLIPSSSYPIPSQTFQTSSSAMQVDHCRRSHLTADGAHALVLAQPCTRPRRGLPPQQHEPPHLPGEGGSCQAVGGRLLRRRKHEDQCGRPIRRPRRRDDRKYREGRGQRQDQAIRNSR